ncbi:major vault protein isoform X2 [Tympanuchus pallidicinctus]|uniref:major vault protein isoform X2 n=1 Tax=Tympanuchus pallidicinctus TaxID=109042 RepID=UPI00228749D6|nr:major vault protein isoform X2 [Tympanuchus pallidicinctus]
MEDPVIRIPPYHYIHVLDLNSNVTRVEVGPHSYIRQDHERVVFSPKRMVIVPPRHYCVVLNPVARGPTGAVLFDGAGQAQLRHADLDVRLTQEPFPLYPGEELQQGVTPLQVVLADTALRLRALLDFEDEDGNKFVAGDEWLFEGPGTYIPHKEVEVVETLQATVIRHNQAIRLRARKECLDRQGTRRVTGEEWLVKRVGAYLPGVYEEVVDVVDAYVLTDKKALHLRATRTFEDAQGHVRRTGEEWLVTQEQSEAYVPDVFEEVVAEVLVTTLGPRQYCVVLDPVGPNGQPQLGQKRVIKGEKSFFLQPGERLQAGIEDVYVLSEDEGLLLQALQTIKDTDEDGTEVIRRAGDRWLARGPLEYVPPAEVTVLERRRALALAENEGIYVRDIRTGKVRVVTGQTYMLTEAEELWEKELPQGVETLLAEARGDTAGQDLGIQSSSGPSFGVQERDRTRAVTYQVPHNAAVQVYDYRERRARVVLGPELVVLGPGEQLTVLSLSGGRPKRPHARRSLCLRLGPDFCADIVTIETADHARLQLQLAYNWHFEVPEDPKALGRLFSVPDFVGDACKALASRVRGAVAAVTFDDFHKNSNRLICSAVFGFDESGRLREHLRFVPNGLVVTSVDIQSVEPVDQRTRDALQRSVQLAIEIATNSQEAAARSPVPCVTLGCPPCVLVAICLLLPLCMPCVAIFPPLLFHFLSPYDLFIPRCPLCPLCPQMSSISHTSPNFLYISHLLKCSLYSQVSPNILSIPLVHRCPCPTSPSIFYVSHATKCPLYLPCFQMSSISSVPPNFIPHTLHPNVPHIFSITCILLCPSIPKAFPVSPVCSQCL